MKKSTIAGEFSGKDCNFFSLKKRENRSVFYQNQTLKIKRKKGAKIRSTHPCPLDLAKFIPKALNLHFLQVQSFILAQAEQSKLPQVGQVNPCVAEKLFPQRPQKNKSLIDIIHSFSQRIGR